ncbi:MAG: SAM-dependent methyltransferase [Betaproteobacteria bacterium]|nr:SAM-dependent methyltransferase [Betaproteobacteria bacterium]
MGSLLPAHLSHLPAPSAEAAANSRRLGKLIADEIAAAGGSISFARFMELALHAPGRGYYSAGARKLGAGGDFVTAPELGSLFARALARQAAQVLREGVADIIEIGAGSGRLARDLLAELVALDCVPQRYLILETSADLRERQRVLLQRELPQLAARIIWLDTLPASFAALVIGNEVLDVMPIHRVVTCQGDLLEQYVRVDETGNFYCHETRASDELRAAAAALALPEHGYTTEIGLAACAFIRTLGSRLARGVALLIDYGFPAREYYHPQRSSGTLMCHYRQHSHADPFCLVGLQDITAHVDFSAIANAAVESGLDLLGYTNQAQFLINCGIADILAATPADDAATYLPLAAQAQILMSPAEMGELFKVIALGSNFSAPLPGFTRGDKRHTL